MARTNEKPLDDSGITATALTGATSLYDARPSRLVLPAVYADAPDPRKLGATDIERMAGFVTALLHKP